MSNTVIQIKKSGATGNIPASIDLNYGELAINYADGKLYFKDSSNQIDSIYTPNQYETLNVNNVLLVPTTPTEILTLNSANGIKLTACTTTETIVIDETLSPIINLAYSTANAAFVKANSANLTYTASNNTPSSPKLGDEWYKIDTDIVYVYSTDGTSNFWLDLSSAKITSNSGGTNSASANVYSNSYTLTTTTTNATEKEAYINGILNTRIPVGTNTTVYYTADVACRRTDTSGDHGAWLIKGVATNLSGNVTDVGTLYEVIVARTDSNFLVDFRADDGNNSVGVYFTGATGKTLSWKAIVTTVEI